jgi:hypothetical protein
MGNDDERVLCDVAGWSLFCECFLVLLAGSINQKKASRKKGTEAAPNTTGPMATAMK